LKRIRIIKEKKPWRFFFRVQNKWVRGRGGTQRGKCRRNKHGWKIYGRGKMERADWVLCRKVSALQVISHDALLCFQIFPATCLPRNMANNRKAICHATLSVLSSSSSSSAFRTTLNYEF
jgi:hypothetical protein